MNHPNDAWEGAPSGEDFAHASMKLEFGAVLELVAAAARSERTRERVRALAPRAGVAAIEESQREILEIVRLREAGRELPLDGWTDSRAIVERLHGPGLLMTPEELAAVERGERTAREAALFLRRAAAECPLASRRAPLVIPQDALIAAIAKAIGPEGEIQDGASHDLARVRREIATVRGRLRRDFAALAEKLSGGRGAEFVTIRGERYVISLPRAEAARCKGIVHQASGSGASLFIEPFELVEKNNRLESLVQEERDEVVRILRALTNEVFERRAEILGNQDVLCDLDLLGAAAVFAARFRCSMPAHSADGSLALREARHPLLERRLAAAAPERSMRPLDLSCGPSLRALVISGPNAGGKTVALKTVGLVTLMDRTGLLVPCRPDSVLPDYERVYVDIGDDQSIDRSLSTFSSRVVMLKRILERADARSLVLIDEIGDGTDPEEGAALAEAVLERLISSCGRVIVTTHLRALKGWAHHTEGAMNATLEFDPDRFEPLFTLRMGVPGRSWGIEVAGRLGLPHEIIERAGRGLGAEALRLEELLAHLENAERVAEAERAELARKEELLAQLIESYRDRLGRIRQERGDLMDRAQRESLEIVTATRKEMERLVAEIRATQAERVVVRTAHEKVQRAKGNLEKKLRARPIAGRLRPEEAKPGGWAVVRSLGKPGRIVSIDSASRIFLELAGGLRVEASLEDLAPAGDPAEGLPRQRASWTMETREPVSDELSVRGLERAEALELVDSFLDRAVLQGLRRVRIIHGIGKGILKRAVYSMLKKDPRVENVQPGEPAHGGDGVAVVDLK